LAQSSPPTLVVSTSSCPESALVEQEILGLTPTLYRGVLSNQIHIQIDDTGAEYTVSVFDPNLRATKSFFDPARDCKRRVRFAAVFVVLTLMPPGIERQSTAEKLKDDSGTATADAIKSGGQSAQSDRAAATESPSRLSNMPEKLPTDGGENGGAGSRVPTKFDDRQTVTYDRLRMKSALRVEAAATLQRTPAVFRSLAMTGVGGEVRGLFGRGHLAVLVSIGYIKRSTFGVDGINGSMRRAPAVVGLQWRLRLHAIELSTEAGAVAMFEHVRGNGFLHSEQNSTVQVGARLGGAISTAYGRLVPYMGAYFSAFPLPQDLVTAPQGVVGTTPALELGITLGGSYAF
jgi:hypothetical protein